MTTRVVVVDLLCNSPYYCGPLTAALREAGAEAVLASPRFYLEPDYLDPYPRASWIVDLVVHARRPRALRLAVRTLELALNASRLLWRIGRCRYDVVHVQWVPFDDRSTMAMRILRAFCDRSRTLLVLTTHNVMPHDKVDLDRSTVRRNLDLASLLIALTDHVAEELASRTGTMTPTAVVPHGPLFVDQRLPSREDGLAHLGLASAPTVLFLGLIRAYKGVDLLVAAWPTVLARIPTARLFVVGSVQDDEARVAVEQARRLAGVHVVDAYVSVARMLDYYAISDVVVFPYHRISQSGALMTAAGLGRPSVISPIDGLLEQARSLRSATVADATSGEAIARALIQALEDRETRRLEAERDQVALEDSPVGWKAIGRATLAAYARHPGRRRA